MTTHVKNVRVGIRRPALRGTIVLFLGGGALIAARSMHADVSKGGWLTSPATAAAIRQDGDNAAALLNAMRGANPIACRLATRSLQNNWGNGNGFIAGPESIGEANDVVFEWAVSRSIEPATIPALRRALDDADDCVRRTAASLLGRVRSSGIADELRAELASGNARTRAAALLAIGYAGDKEDRAAAEHALNDADASVRLTAVWAVGHIGSSSSVSALSGLLRDSDPVMRASAALALGEIGAAEAVPALASLLGSDSDARVRRAAANALGRID